MFRDALLLQFQREYDLAFVPVVEILERFNQHADERGSRQPQLAADALQVFFLLRLQAHGKCCFFSHAGIEAYCVA